MVSKWLVPLCGWHYTDIFKKWFQLWQPGIHTPQSLLQNAHITGSRRRQPKQGSLWTGSPELPASIIFQTLSPCPWRSFFWLLRRMAKILQWTVLGPVPCRECKPTTLPPLVTRRCVLLGSCKVFQKLGYTDHNSKSGIFTGGGQEGDYNPSWWHQMRHIPVPALFNDQMLGQTVSHPLKALKPWITCWPLWTSHPGSWGQSSWLCTKV